MIKRKVDARSNDQNATRENGEQKKVYDISLLFDGLTFLSGMRSAGSSASFAATTLEMLLMQMNL